MTGRTVTSLLLAVLGSGCTSDPGEHTSGHAPVAQAQADSASLQAEIVAAQDILRAYTSHRIVVDSVFAVAEEAPGGITAEVRPSHRTRALQATLEGSPRRAADTVVLRLSRPNLEHGVAAITVTVEFPDPDAPGSRGYETIQYMLDGRGPRWRILTRQQLGIT